MTQKVNKYGEYRGDFRAVEREVYWTLPRIAIGLAFAGLVFGAVGYTANILSAPARVISKTLETDNIINNYEWFHDAAGNFQAKTAQVRQFKGFEAAETNPAEKGRLRVDMAAIEQSCRELARRYNANSAKINRAIFKGTTTPETLNAGECE